MAVASNGYVPAPAWQPGIELRRHPGLWHHLRHAVDSGATRGAGRGFGAEVSGPVRTPGQRQCRPLSDKWLLDYPNMYADLSANSGNDVLSRTPGSSRVSFSKASRQAHLRRRLQLPGRQRQAAAFGERSGAGYSQRRGRPLYRRFDGAKHAGDFAAAGGCRHVSQDRVGQREQVVEAGLRRSMRFGGACVLIAVEAFMRVMPASSGPGWARSE